jgi:probable DNA repair protein
MIDLRPCRLEDVGDGVVLCATHRLARRLRADHDQAQRLAGREIWTPLTALGIDAWLAQVIDGALLEGSLAATEVPRLALSPLHEQVLWEQAIAASGGEAGGDVLLDREGLAELAVEANALAETWNLSPDESGSAETQAFLRWRSLVRQRCEPGRWLDSARMRNWRIGRIAAGAGRLPSRLAFAGFDRYTPQEIDLARALQGRGVAVLYMELAGTPSTDSMVAELPDRGAECRAAAAWAKRCLADSPQTRVAIVVPQLAAVREALVAALDDALHPESLSPANAEMRRDYNVSLGLPLGRWPLADVALRLLRIAVQPRRIAQTELASLLRSHYWSSGSPSAMVARSRLDARMRDLLPPTVALSQVLRLARRLQRDGLPLAEVVAHLETLQEAGARSRRDDPRTWADNLVRLLSAAGWPGERTLSSHEWQVRRAFSGVLQELGGLLLLLDGRCNLADAVRHLARFCRQRIFQPQSEGSARLEVLGPLEAAGGRFDALWVLGMNDDVWPPPPRPNPLLPAVMQRRAGSPNAGADVQLEFAAAIHRRLLSSARDIVFSWASREGDRPLRMSPLLAGLPNVALPATESGFVAARNGGAIERIHDCWAPPLVAGTKARGGVGLLKAQAACPAWAFYRYRLGALALEQPSEGLNAAERGTLLHRVMERFWRGRDSASLHALREEERSAAVADAVQDAIRAFDEAREVAMSPRFAALEGERLRRVLSQWLGLELARPLPFVVAACELVSETDIGGLKIDVRVDRIDALADGRMLILDYKTGSDLKISSWLGERIAEPQLPVYAAWTAVQPPAAVAFARLRDDDCGFVGLSADGGMLPGVRVIEDWSATLAAWRNGIALLADEILAGDAGVRVADEKLLRYCEVLPLLRLPEWRSEMERA